MKRILIPTLSAFVLAFWTIPAFAGQPPPPAVSFNANCQGPGTPTQPGAVFPGQNDSCTITVASGSVHIESNVTITGTSPAGAGVTACSGSFSGTACTFSNSSGDVTQGQTVGTETISIPASTSPGSAVQFAGKVCHNGPPCISASVSTSGAGAVVSNPPPPPPPPPPPAPVAPWVMKTCGGPNHGGTVYAGQQDSCAVNATWNNTFTAGQTVTIAPTSPSGATIATCDGLLSNGYQTTTQLAADGSSCVITVSGSVPPGQMMAHEVLDVPATASSGTAIQQTAGFCSPAVCTEQPSRIDVTGTGSTVATDPAVSATGTSLAAPEGQALPWYTIVATYTDGDPYGRLGEYSATIDWGDGTPPTAGGLSAYPGESPLPVHGSHTYAEEGSYTITVTMSDTDTAYNVTTALTDITVADGALSAAGTSLNSTNPFAATIATFSDANPNATLSDYSSTIAWGDGTTSAGTVGLNTASNASPFAVTGSHTYAQLGPYTVTTHVCDVGGSCADATSQVLVYGLSDGGNFVIGDGNAAVGSSVTIWGAQWASSNTVSGGSAPDAFKGFADDPRAAPACGSGWATSPGNSASPPATIPTYMAVNVASSVTKHGPNVTGDTVSVVIVKTDPGYGPDPGQPGTGTVVAVLC